MDENEEGLRFAGFTEAHTLAEAQRTAIQASDDLYMRLVQKASSQGSAGQAGLHSRHMPAMHGRSAGLPEGLVRAPLHGMPSVSAGRADKAIT